MSLELIEVSLIVRILRRAILLSINHTAGPNRLYIPLERVPLIKNTEDGWSWLVVLYLCFEAAELGALVQRSSS